MPNFPRFALPAAVVTLLGGALAVSLALAAPAAPADGAGKPSPAASAAAVPAISVVPGMPPVADAKNLYSETTSDKMSKATSGALERI